MHIFMV